MFRIPICVLMIGLVAGCQKKVEQTTASDSTSYQSSSTPANSSVDESLQIPSVPDVPKPATLDSQVKAVVSLPESDSMDVRTRVQFKTIAGAETVVRGTELFVIGVDREDSATIVHCVLQNLWGATTRLHPQAIRVALGADQVAKAKLLDDLTGKTLLADPNRVKGRMEVASGGTMMLKPSETKTMVFAFPPISKLTRTATLIVPGFATVSGMPLQ